MKKDDEDDNVRYIQESRKDKIKSEILDENFKRAEISQGLRPPERKIQRKKPFLKSGIIILITAMVCIAFIQFLPWMQVNFVEDNQNQSLGYGRNVENIHYNISKIFKSDCINCTNNSQNYIGLNLDDFSKVPFYSFIGFVILALLGIILIIFQIFDKIRNFSFVTISLFHSMFAIGIITTSIFLLTILIRFISAYFMFFYNYPFLLIDDVKIIFIVPIFLIILIPIIMKGGFVIIKMNFNELKKQLKPEVSKDFFSSFGLRRRHR